MTQRTCVYCKATKPISEFTKAQPNRARAEKVNAGYYVYCKVCGKDEKFSFINRSYDGRIHNTKISQRDYPNQNIPDFTLTFDEFINWILDPAQNFDALWTASNNGTTDDKPSVDRYPIPACKGGGYVIGNMRLIPNSQNVADGRAMNGVEVKEVTITDINTGNKTKFDSYSGAARVYGVDPASISCSIKKNKPIHNKHPNLYASLGDLDTSKIRPMQKSGTQRINVTITDINTGNKTEFDSLKDAARAYNVKGASIGYAIKNNKPIHSKHPNLYASKRTV